MRRLLNGMTMVDVAIERLTTFGAAALAKHPDGYYLAFSGGKDSVAILGLAKEAGVKFTAHHNLTTCDPPELVRFIKTFPQVAIHIPRETMWQLVRRMGMPPRRQARFCCQVLKEGGGAGRVVLTGVRAGESNRRSKRQYIEPCMRDGSRTYLHPIFDWSTQDVWDYIRERGLSYCSLYDEGWKRLGCVLCPMTRDVERQMNRWPKIAAAWERAVKATFKPDKVGFATAEEYWQWWLDRDAPSRASAEPTMFDDDGAESAIAADAKAGVQT